MIGWGIIGIGKHADTRMAPALRRTVNSRLVAVCSRDQRRAHTFAQRHGAAVGYDSVAMLLRLSGGGFALVESSRRLPWANNDIVVYGGRARVSGLGTVGTFLQGSLQLVSESVSWRDEYLDPDPATGLYAAMIEDFSRCVDKGEQPAATGEDGLAMARLTEAVLCSACEARTVRLEDDLARSLADADAVMAN